MPLDAYCVGTDGGFGRCNEGGRAARDFINNIEESKHAQD